MTDEIEITSINTFAKATRAIAGCLYTLDLTPVNAVRGRIHDLSHNDYTEEEVIDYYDDPTYEDYEPSPYDGTYSEMYLLCS